MSMRQRSTSSTGRAPYPSSASVASSTWADGGPLKPCAATASIFIFAQGRSIICLHHDSLQIERRFEKHKGKVLLLEVDNVSERGAGRLVVSYDDEKTAIVWDLFTGDEITRFASFEPLAVAAWMKDGNIAFGNNSGNVITFQPSTSEHTSAKTIYDPITALAPSGDCRTYAIGYNNGSLLIVSLERGFTILHTLTTSAAPSPITGLAWHASSSKQRSDMLAVQSGNGELRVWSISKPPGAETPRVIRTLKRGDETEDGTHWISWSKMGRILQYSQGETWAWDVRTKHVAYEPVPTIDRAQGIANYGPGAVLFTLGPNHTVQQYELSPPSMVKEVQHKPKSQTGDMGSTTPKLSATIPGAAPPIYRSVDHSRGGPSLSQIQRVSQGMTAIDQAGMSRYDLRSPAPSTSSRADSISSRSSAGGRSQRAPSVSSRGGQSMKSGTTFSALSPSAAGRESMISGSFWQPPTSIASSSHRSRTSRRPKLGSVREEESIVDLFPYTRNRLANMPYAPQSSTLDPNTATPPELRSQMLEIVFGWHGDIEAMVREEMSHHAPGSMNMTLLSKWLGDPDSDIMSMMGSNNITQNDWMLLALSSMNGQGPAGQQMIRMFSDRLLSQGDIHTAATVLLGINDYDQAIAIYTSRHYYMESIILSSLLFPDDWPRQANLVQKWGEFVVENSQQHLAIRCFTCTGSDASLPWASPTHSPFQGKQPQSFAQTLSPPTSPPGDKPGRMTAKNASLRLITTFDAQAGTKPNFKFPGLKTADNTPTVAPGVTPIAESALDGDMSGAYGRRGMKTPLHERSRLPSIGETPIDVNPPAFPINSGPVPKDAVEAPLPTPGESEIDFDAKSTSTIASDTTQQKVEEELTLSAVKYDPEEDKKKAAAKKEPKAEVQAKPQIEVQPKPQIEVQTKPLLGLQTTPPSASQATPIAVQATPQTAVREHWSNNQEFPAAKLGHKKQGASRDRKPSLHIQAPSLSQLNLNAIATGADGKTPVGYRQRSMTTSSIHSSASAKSGASYRESQQETPFSIASPPYTGKSWSSMKSPSVSGRETYISSLEEANYHAKIKKEKTRQREARSKTRQRQPSEDRERGRSSQRYVRPAKRSPSSPVPMSPEDLALYRNVHGKGIESSTAQDSSDDAMPQRTASRQRKSQSKTRSASKYTEVPISSSRRGSRATSRRRSPERAYSRNEGRGRSQSRGAGGPRMRSPPSPLPTPDYPPNYRQEEADDTDPMRLVNANRERLRSRQRSTSRRPSENRVSPPNVRDRSSTRRDRSTTRRDQSVSRRDRSVNRRDQSSSRRDRSTDRRRYYDESERSRHYDDVDRRRYADESDRYNSNAYGDEYRDRYEDHRRHDSFISQRSAKQEIAARELEARRISLAQRTQTPVTRPESLYSRPPMSARSQTDLSMLNSPLKSGNSLYSNSTMGFSDTFSPAESNFSQSDRTTERAPSTGPYGLPATPRAMQRPPKVNFPTADDIPDVPMVPDQYYATGQPVNELPRSTSCPVYTMEEKMARNTANGRAPPGEMPFHPAVQKNLRSTMKRPNLPPLSDIGAPRKSSVDAQSNGSPPYHAGQIGSINETLNSDVHVIDVPVSGSHTPDVVPELAHLATPPPPPPIPANANWMQNFSMQQTSNGDALGMINIVMDDDDKSRGPTPLSRGAAPQQQQQQPQHSHRGSYDARSEKRPSPPNTASIQAQIQANVQSQIQAQEATSPTSKNHRRGRSIDHTLNKFSRMTQRMRSSSRGRQAPRKYEISAPSPYEARI